MFRVRHLAFVTSLAIAAPPVMAAQTTARWNTPKSSAFEEGYGRGQIAGAEDFRKNKHFDFTDESDYKKADFGYRSDMGHQDAYKDDFRRGYAEGYAAGFGPADLRSTDVLIVSRDIDPDRLDDSLTRVTKSMDPALATGFNDGYREGLKDGHAGHRNDPTGESRYDSGDHGYDSSYGPKDRYKLRYRDAFIQGYERGFNDGAN